MNKKTISAISTITLIAALGLGLYVIISNWIASRDLPVGVCLTNSQRGLMFTAIGLAIVSFAASFFEKDKDDAEASIDTGTDSMDYRDLAGSQDSDEKENDK
ncbi:MAG: hypothetical protein WAP98_05585 [Caldicoprobacterales bacterium]|jgi:hypothetical protein